MARPDLDVLLCYDITKNSRRTKLHKRLQKWLQPVQLSVMEGRIHPRHLPALLGLVQRTIDPEADSVRIYLLCGGCRTSTMLMGTAQPLPDPTDPVVI
jgi:CRISPR-associated protein Cas2